MTLATLLGRPSRYNHLARFIGIRNLRIPSSWEACRGLHRRRISARSHIVPDSNGTMARSDALIVRDVLLHDGFDRALEQRALRPSQVLWVSLPGPGAPPSALLEAFCLRRLDRRQHRPFHRLPLDPSFIAARWQPLPTPTLRWPRHLLKSVASRNLGSGRGPMAPMHLAGYDDGCILRLEGTLEVAEEIRHS